MQNIIGDFYQITCVILIGTKPKGQGHYKKNIGHSSK